MNRDCTSTVGDDGRGRAPDRIYVDFFIVRPDGTQPISSEHYDLWTVDQAAKAMGASLIRDMKNRDLCGYNVPREALRMDEESRWTLEHCNLLSPIPNCVLDADGMEVTFAAAGAALAFLKTIQPVILEWIKARANRNIRVEGKGFSITIGGDVDIETAVRLLAEIEERTKHERMLKKSERD